MQWVRPALGAVNRTKMMLIINSSAALLKAWFLQHMQKVKVTTLWNFCWLPHLFIIDSLDARGKNSGFWNNVCGRWSLQSCSLALSQFDLLGEALLVQSFPSTASNAVMSQCKRNYCAVIPLSSHSDTLKWNFSLTFRAREVVRSFFPSLSFIPKGKRKRLYTCWCSIFINIKSKYSIVFTPIADANPAIK